MNGYTNNHVAKFIFNFKSLFNARSALYIQLRFYNYQIIIYTFFRIRLIAEISMVKI